jgi:hypothetical protein
MISRQTDISPCGLEPVHGDAVNSFFIVFVHHQNAPGPPTIYRGDEGKVVVYNSSAEAEARAAQLTAINKSPNVSFTVTEFQPCDSLA